MKRHVLLSLVVWAFLLQSTAYAWKPKWIPKWPAKRALKSQAAIIKRLKRIKPSLSAKLDPKRYWSVMSSVISNRNKLTEYEMEHRGFTSIRIANDDGFVREGYIRANQKPGPFLVCMAGVTGDRESASFRVCLDFMRKYGWGGLLIENVTSANWVKNNQRLIVSGYESGRDGYLVVKAIRESLKYGPMIDKIHLLGISLGGNDAAFVSYFSDCRGENVIDGAVLAMSSPGNRAAALQDVRNKTGVLGRVLRMWFQGPYEAGRELINSYYPVSAYDYIAGVPLATLVEYVYLPMSRAFFKARPDAMAMLHADIEDVGNAEQQLSLSGFLRMSTLNTIKRQQQTPLLFLHAQDDFIVSAANTRAFVKSVRENPRIGLLMKRNGGHVGFREAYSKGWVKLVLYRYFSYWSKR